MARAEQGKQAKRKAILEAAVRVFAEKGYFGARMRDVAAAAQVADGTLYLYFDSKEDLLTAVLEEHAQAFVERARRDCGQLSDPRHMLRAVLERHFASLEANRALATVFQIELRHSRKFLRRIAKGQVSQYLQLLQELVASGVSQGVFRRELDPKVAARVIFGAVDELVTAWVLSQKPSALKQQLAPLLEVLFYGLCTDQRNKVHGKKGGP
ncbi:MAG: TetR/AcrR family transcriptional regulator [Thermoanaerobaculum sp.]